MPLLNSILSWQCPILSFSFMLCMNYLHWTTVTKLNWLTVASFFTLAVLTVDYFHRFTVVHHKWFRIFAKLKFLKHGISCYDEATCHNFLGDGPQLLYNVVCCVGLILSYFVPECAILHCMVLSVSMFGLVVERYVSFIDLSILLFNILLVAAGLHKMGWLKPLLIPVRCTYLVLEKQLEKISSAASDLEEKFVEELNSPVNTSTSKSPSLKPLLSAAMEEMYLLDDNARARTLRRKIPTVGEESVYSDDDSDCDSFSLNRSRLPSPSRSYSSTEDLAAPIDNSLLFSEDEDYSKSPRSFRPNNQNKQDKRRDFYRRSSRNAVAKETHVQPHTNTLGSLDPQYLETVTNSLYTGFKFLGNMTTRFYQELNVPQNEVAATGDEIANSGDWNDNRSRSEEFEFVPPNNANFAQLTGDQEETQPSTQQVDSQGPYQFYYETRSKTNRRK